MSEWALPQPRWHKLQARIRGLTGRPDAEDLLQSAVVRFLERGTAGVNNADAYLVQSARNMAIDLSRQERRSPAMAAAAAECVEDIACPGELPDELLLIRQRLERLRAGCENMTVRTREIFLLHRIDGLSYRVASQRLHISVSAVEKHVSKAMCHLSEWMMD